MSNVLSRVCVRLLVGLVRVYQCAFHGLMGYGSCRFTPTCSNYMIEALRVHGAWRGLGLGLWRILRCNPFCQGGHDPVPPRSIELRSDGHESE